MSVVAWNGFSLCTDKRAVNHAIHTVTKSKKISDTTVVAWVGNQDQGLALCAWYEDGASVDEYPKFQSTDNWTCLVVATKDQCEVYNQVPHPIIVEEEFYAFGSGAAYALAAMSFGYSAYEAVEVAAKFDNHCGNGIDMYVLEAL